MAETDREPEGAPQDPREHRGLRDRLRDMLIEKRSPGDVQAEAERAAQRQERIDADAAAQAAKLTHLEEVSGEHRIVTPEHRNDRVSNESTPNEDETNAA